LRPTLALHSQPSSSNKTAMRLLPKAHIFWPCVCVCVCVCVCGCGEAWQWALRALMRLSLALEISKRTSSPPPRVRGGVCDLPWHCIWGAHGLWGVLEAMSWQSQRPLTSLHTCRPAYAVPLCLISNVCVFSSWARRDSCKLRAAQTLVELW
jgi:hypothetical protein